MAEPPSIGLSRRPTGVSVVPDPAGGPCDPKRTDAAAGEPAADPSAETRQAKGLLEKERGDLKLARLALESGLERLLRMESQWPHEAEEQIVELALAIAAKVLMQEIRAGRHEIDPIVKAMLARLPAAQDVVVRMHPEDLSRSEMARPSGQDPAGALGGLAHVQFVADSTVKRAECILETQHGFVNADVESHLRELSKALRSSE